MIRRTRDDKGQDLVEYAIVFILLFTLILGIIEFGIIIFTQSTLSNVAREGARWAVVRRAIPAPGSYLPSIGNSVDEYCDSPSNSIASLGACPKALGIDAARVHVVISRPSSDEIRVQASYAYDPFFGLFDPLFPGGVTLGSQSTMRLE